MIEKHCNTCGQTKSVELFAKDKRRKNGIGSECKACVVVRAKKWVDANKSKHYEHVEKWRLQNIEKVAIARRIYVKRNKDLINKRAKIFRLANPEYYLKRAKEYAKKNPEKIKENNAKRRALRRDLMGEVSKNITAKLKHLQQNKCPCCGEKLGDKYHLDHIIPLSLGGRHEDANLQLLKASCNQKKYNKHPIDFMQEKGFLL